MSVNLIVMVLAAGLLVTYLLRRRARLRSDDDV